MDVAVVPVSVCFGEEAVIRHLLHVREMQLEHVAAGFDVEAHGQWVGEARVELIRQRVEIFHVNRNPLRQFLPYTDAEQQHVVLDVHRVNKVAVNKGGSDLP